MQHRQLPNQLKQCVRNYDQFRWIATHGVDEQQILKSLPLDLRRHIKRHLCLDLLRQVPLLDEMEETMLDAICERLNPYLITSNTYLIREGDPVNEMLFIIRGYLDSHTTNGGRTGFFNSSRLGPSDFCGEELLPWALVDDPRTAAVFPSSTRTVKAVTEVEGFALVAEDLKFVAAQFRKLHSKQIRSTFRFYSHQWRTWAACFIQAAWFRYKRRMKKEEEDEINVVRKMNVVHHRSLDLESTQITTKTTIKYGKETTFISTTPGLVKDKKDTSRREDGWTDGTLFLVWF
ncbi:hypothetical protein Csa_002862 [Cucumis sativus]|nr:hypothetical protein Csa_002862 [Cucumis sativus]